MREQERGEAERQETPAREKCNRHDLTEEGREKREQRQTGNQSVLFSSERIKVMAENNTNLFMEILHSFDAGKYFYVVPICTGKKKSNQIPGIQVKINTGIETL